MKMTEKESQKHPEESPLPPWIELPRDVTTNILHRLGAIEIMNSAEKVCTTWCSVCKDPLMWKVVDLRNSGNLRRGQAYKMEMIYRQAVDRSQGKLIDLNIEYFGCNESLFYLSERSSLLKDVKRIALAECYKIKGQKLCEACEKFPQLEELHLFNMNFCVSARSIEAIGRACPMLKSFTYNHLGVMNDRAIGNSISLAVAKTMPGLQHLQLFGNFMNNNGLKAILDGCSHLESLGLRDYVRIDLKGDLGEDV